MPAGKACVDQQGIPEFRTDCRRFLQMVKNILLFAGKHSGQLGVCESRIVHFRFDEFVGFRILFFHFGQEADGFCERTEYLLSDLEFHGLFVGFFISGMHNLKIPEFRRICPILRLRHRILFCLARCAGGLRVRSVSLNFLSAVVTSEHNIVPFDCCGCSFCLQASNKIWKIRYFSVCLFFIFTLKLIFIYLIYMFTI